VWHQARVLAEGRATLPLAHAPEVLIDHGVEPIGAPMTVTGIEGFVLHTLDRRLAATTLRRLVAPLPPLHTLSLATLDAQDCIVQCWPLVALHEDGTATVSARLFPGQRVCWMLQRVAPVLPQGGTRHASFALVFGCGARAMAGGEDGDWRAVRERWPGLPFAGFYGNGQFAAPHGETLLLQRSLVVSLHD
jgi:small ligand-binding sensory domain FIST